MADLKKLAEELVNLTVKDVKELADILKEEYGIEPAAAAVAVAAPAAAAADEGPTTKTVVLKNAGAAKIAVIKVIREITGLGLVEAKGLADNGGNIKENVSVDEANQIKAKLEEAGAEVELA